MVLSMERWVGKVAVVTGVSAGIGAKIAEMMVKNGMIVVGIARRIELVEELAETLRGQPGKLHPMKVDLTNDEELVKAFEEIEQEFDPVHVLVNNAAVYPNGRLWNGSIESWRQIMDTNVLALCIATKEAIRIMKKYGVNGDIININSVAGHKVPPLLDLNIYPASKFAVTAICDSLRMELASERINIRVTSVSPGAVLTDSMKKVDVSSVKYFPVLNAEDIADAVQYALSTPPHVQIKELMVTPLGENF